MTEPDLSPEPGWAPLDIPPYVLGDSFVSGDPASQALRARWFQVGPRDLAGRVWFGPRAKGPPGHAHGGSMAAVLDEALGATAWMVGASVVAATLTTRFRALLPLGTVVTAHARVAPVEGRRVRATGRLVGPDGTVHADAEGIFVQIDPERFRRLLREAR